MDYGGGDHYMTDQCCVLLFVFKDLFSVSFLPHITINIMWR